MAGLLDFLDSGDAQLGLGLLAAASARSDGAGFGQRLLEGVGHAQSWKQQKKKDEYAQTLLDAQKFEMEQKRLEAQQKQAALERDAKIKAGMGQFFKPGQQALSPLVGDPSIGIMPSAGRAAVAPSFDAAGASSFLAQNGDYKGAFDLIDKFKPVQVKLKNVEQMKDPQTGKMVNVALYENGETKVLPFGVKPDMQILSLGDRQVAVDKNSVAPGESFAFGQSPDSKASNAVAWANNALSRERLNFDKAGGAEGGKPQLVDGQWVYKPDFQNPNGRVVPVQGLSVKSMTDSQSKANLFGTRAMEAEAAIQSLKGKADRPGWIKRTSEATAGMVPFAGEKLADVTGSALNWTQSDAQQQVEQAQRNFINAILRRESGAVIGADEFANARKQYFPMVGDSEAVLSQKERNRQTAIGGIMAEVPAGNRPSATPPAGAGPFNDPGKESRYQAWKRANGG